MKYKEISKKVEKVKEELINFFLDCTIKDISQVYEGKRNCCRCGCGGEYYATSFMENPRSEVNDKKVLELLKVAKKFVKLGADVEHGDTYFDVEVGNDKTLTFYFDEVMK